MGRGREFYGLPKSDRLLALSGAPISYLKKKISPSQLHFVTTSVQAAKGTFIISPKSQTTALGDVLENIDALGGPGLYVVGSFPTQQAGYELGTLISREFFNFQFAQGEMGLVKWIDLGHPEWDFLKSSEECDLAVIHGLSEQTETKKLEIAKDFLRRTEAATTIVIATTPNIMKFVVEKLGTNPDIVWQLAKTSHHNLT